MKFCLVIYFCLVFIAVAITKNVRVIGGEDADIKDFPFIAQIRLHKEKMFVCAGIIISDRHILTAAHCFYRLSKSDVKVYTGTDNSSFYSVPSYNIRSIKIHPNFVAKEKRNWKLSNDIAVVLLDSCIQFNEYQNEIQLPFTDVLPGDTGLMVGWGKISYPVGIPSEKLTKVSTTVISNDECIKKFPGLITKDQICLFQSEEIGTCHGDSGGPLISNGRLVGISSFSRPGVKLDPDVYTRVYSYLDFIDSSMNSWTNYFPCFT